MYHSTKIFTSACALVTLLTGAALLTASAARMPMNIRGTIVSETATNLVVKTAGGPVSVNLIPKTGYAGATTGSMADIKPNTFLGIASVPGGTTSKALEVAVFPESMRGVGEGDYGWDLKAGGAHSMMTNGSVAMGANRTHSMMTNGSASMMTNGTASKMGGTTITMKYKGGSRVITIPPNASIVKLAPGSKKLLAVGAHVFVIPKKTPQGTVGVFVVVGENGAIPPM